MTWKSKDVVSFLAPPGVVGKDLTHEDAGIPVVDADGNFHFFEREDGGIGLLLVARNENARIGEQQRRIQNRDNDRQNQLFHECSFCSGMRTRPLSVPM